MGDALALLTAFVLICYLVAILDDVAFDLYGLLWFGRRKSQGIPSGRILDAPPKRLAVMVPAWREAGVVSSMVEATLELMNYPRDRLHVFVGVYPNDPATIADVEDLCGRHPNVHLVENWRPGPTTKSQNLNFLYRAIERFEESDGARFDGIAVHDAEDVIHPYAFRVYGALLDEHAMVQLPVIPLLPKGSWWRRTVAGTYADEFSEQHLHHVPIRQALRGFVPSAGTGFVIRRDVLSALAERGSIFREEALTEDYELALRLRIHGYRVHFHLQQVRRIDDRGRVVHEYVGVREHFPQDVAAAIRQKARWIYGVALQTGRLIGERQIRRLSFRDRLFVARDRKAKYTNLVHLIGYPLAFYALISTVAPLPYGEVPALLPLALLVLSFTILRLCVRAYFVGKSYGFRQAMWAGFLPPLIPLRWLLGNWINTRATMRAWRLYFLPGRGQERGSAPAWDKTVRREYADEVVLRDARRRMGDDLIFFHDVRPEDVAELVRRQREEADPVRLGWMAVEERLVEDGAIERHTSDADGSEDEPEDALHWETR